MFGVFEWTEKKLSCIIVKSIIIIRMNLYLTFFSCPSIFLTHIFDILKSHIGKRNSFFFVSFHRKKNQKNTELISSHNVEHRLIFDNGKIEYYMACRWWYFLTYMNDKKIGENWKNIFTASSGENPCRLACGWWGGEDTRIKKKGKGIFFEKGS